MFRLFGSELGGQVLQLGVAAGGGHGGVIGVTAALAVQRQQQRTARVHQRVHAGPVGHLGRDAFGPAELGRAELGQVAEAAPGHRLGQVLARVLPHAHEEALQLGIALGAHRGSQLFVAARGLAFQLDGMGQEQFNIVHGAQPNLKRMPWPPRGYSQATLLCSVQITRQLPHSRQPSVMSVTVRLPSAL